ncbi:MAG: TIGR03086 family metal-binding protein [Egibacteraceae bacterium]
MDLIGLHDRALAATTGLVANVRAEQFSNPTPCAELDVRALLNHLVAGNYRYVNIAHGEPAEPVPLTGDFVHGDALTPYRKSAAAVSQAWVEPILLERTVHLPFGAVPGAVALGVHTVEAIVHGWTWQERPGSRPSLIRTCAPWHGRTRRTSTTASAGRVGRSDQRYQPGPAPPTPHGSWPGSAVNPERGYWKASRTSLGGYPQCRSVSIVRRPGAC